MNSANPGEVILATSIIVGALLLVSVLKKEKTEELKLFLFWGMTIPVILATLFLVADTITENQQSVTRGPVHWHADFEIYACGERQDLLNPSGLANRIGTPVLHEHGDDRIHVEGTVRELADVTLASFFEVIGGRLEHESMAIPTNEGMLTYRNGDQCPSGQAGSLQIFLYETDPSTNTITQRKLDDFPEYVPSPHTIIPPGDCIIFEFTDEIKERTDEICNFYEIEINKGDLRYAR